MIDLRHEDGLEVMRGLPAESVDFIFTDPPYGHNNNDGGDLIERWERALGQVREEDRPPSRPISNDGEEANELVRAFFTESRRVLVKGGVCCCCCGGGGPDPQFARWALWMDELLGFKQAVVWDKGPIGMGWHYRRSYEFVLVGEKPGAACRWHDTTNKVENILRFPFAPRKIIPAANEHPTAKPWTLAAHFIQLHTRPGDLVVDPFMGGGSTAEACVRLGRRFVGCDIDGHWVKYATARVAGTHRPLPGFDEVVSPSSVAGAKEGQVPSLLFGREEQTAEVSSC